MTRAIHMASAPTAVSSMMARDWLAAAPSVASDRQRSERERPGGFLGEAQADGHAGEHADVDDVVSPEVEDGASGRLHELEPGELAVAAVEDRVRQEQERADELIRR